LENLGINVIRIEDKDVRFALNDVIRALEITVENIVENKKNIPPSPSKGESEEETLQWGRVK
jgi:hypothetical protein